MLSLSVPSPSSSPSSPPPRFTPLHPFHREHREGGVRAAFTLRPALFRFVAWHTREKRVCLVQCLRCFFSLPLFLPPFFFSCDDEKTLFLFFFSKSPYNLSRAIFSFAFYPCQSFLPIHRIKLYKLLLRKIRGAWNKNSFRDGGRMLNGLFRLFLFRVLKNELDRMISLA